MQAASIDIKVERGKVTVLAIGRSPRGNRYIKGQVPLKVTSIADKNFKAEMAAAVDQLLGSTA